MIRRLLVIAGVVIALVIALELTLGNWIRHDPLTGLMLTRNGAWSYRVDYPGIADQDRRVLYSRDQYGMRGLYGDIEDIDILVVGGSAAEQRFLDNSRTFQQVIRDDLSEKGYCVDIANAALSGRSTFGHAQDFDDWFSRLDGLSPGYVLFFVGLTDVFLDGPNTGWDEIHKVNAMHPKELIRDHSVLYRWFRLYLGPWLPKTYDLSFLALDFSGPWTESPNQADVSARLRPRAETYAGRLRELSRRVEDMGAVPIFVTQKRGDYLHVDNRRQGLVNTRSRTSNIKKDAYLGHLNKAELNGVDQHALLSLFNTATMEVCREVNGVCLDMEAGLELTVGDFSDHAHLTSSGAAKVGHWLSQALENPLRDRFTGVTCQR